jgi:hypothetical protein
MINTIKLREQIQDWFWLPDGSRNANGSFWYCVPCSEHWEQTNCITHFLLLNGSFPEGNCSCKHREQAGAEVSLRTEYFNMKYHTQ